MPGPAARLPGGPYAASVPEVQEQLTTTLTALTAQLVSDHDVDAVLRLVTSACVELLGAAATGVMLVDPRGGVAVVAASDERSRFVELLQANSEQGPCVDSIRADSVIRADDLAGCADRWPLFVPAALDAGFRSVHAVPMRLDGQAVGGLNLFFTVPTTPQPWQEQLVRLFADLAVIGISQERDSRRADRLAERTLTTLNDRIELAHAIGLVAGTLGIEPEQARILIVTHAVALGVPVRDTARAITTGALPPADLTH